MTKEKLCENNTGVLTVVFIDESQYTFLHESPVFRTKDVELTSEQLTLLKCHEHEEIYKVIVEPHPPEGKVAVDQYHRYVKGKVSVLIVNYGGIELGIPCSKRVVRLHLTKEQTESLEKRFLYSTYVGNPSVEREYHETVSDAIITIKEL